MSAFVIVTDQDIEAWKMERKRKRETSPISIKSQGEMGSQDKCIPEKEVPSFATGTKKELLFGVFDLSNAFIGFAENGMGSREGKAQSK